MSRLHTRESGFSLYEMLLAIALTGIVTTWAVVTYSRTIDIWSGIRTASDLNAEADHAYDALTKDFASVVSTRLSGIALTATPDKAASDSGAVADAIVLPVQAQMRSANEAKDRLTGAAVSYSLDPSTHTLVRSIGPITSTKPAGYPQPVAKNITSMRIEYPGASDGQPWTTSWAGPGLPKAVRVSLALTDPKYPDKTLSRKAVFAIHVQ